LLAAGNREQAFAYALSSASLVHTLAKACSAGLSSKCHCADPGATSGHAPAGARADPPPPRHQWGGCADDVEFAAGFGREFTDRVWKRRRASRRAAVNLHNSVAGRRVRIPWRTIDRQFNAVRYSHLRWLGSRVIIAKFHYTRPTGPDRTRPDKVRGLCQRPRYPDLRQSPLGPRGSPTKSADFVWSGRACLVEFSY